MQTVSESWKNAHKQTLLGESYVEVSLDIADPDSLANAKSEDNGGAYISNGTKIADEVDASVIPYGTLEQNSWLLDGSRKSIPESNYKDGSYIGDVLSNEEGVFNTKIPTITIKFTEVFTKPIPGLSITWGTAYNEYAAQFVVTAYNGETIVAQKEIIDNTSVTSIVTMDIVNYDRITIQVLSWCLPNHRARVAEIFVGWHKVYSKADLFSYSHTQKVDPISTSLPKMEIKFSIDNSDDTYNPYNLNGLAKYLFERQEVAVRYGLKLSDNTVEWIKGGKFYLSEWYAKQNGMTADFVARDLLEYMSDIYVEGSSYSPGSRSLYLIATRLLERAHLPLTSDGKVRWVISESLLNHNSSAPLPADSIANCLQLVANAGCCVLYQDRDGIVHIEPITSETTDYAINQFNSYSKPELTFSKQIKEVVVKAYVYSPSSEVDYIGRTDFVTTVGEIGETIVIDNPLITNEARAKAVGEWIGNYLKNRMALKSSMRADVRLDALDLITNENDYGTNTMRVTDVEFQFNGAFHGTVEGRVI